MVLWHSGLADDAWTERSWGWLDQAAIPWLVQKRWILALAVLRPEHAGFNRRWISRDRPSRFL